MTEHKLIIHSRPRADLDWQCPRKRYWHYEYDGKGIVTDTTYLELYLGTTIHDGLAAFAHGKGIEEVAAAAHAQMLESLLKPEAHTPEEEEFAKEQATLTEGLLRGFHKHVWPRLMEEYPTIVAIEEPMTYKHDGLAFLAKPDLVVEDKEGNFWYIEYKSTSSKKDAWINSWETAIQLHATVRAIEQTKGVKLTGVVVQGLYKGYETYGKQTSPFCYAYRKSGNPPFLEDQISYEYRAGWKKYPVWNLEGGIKSWVENMSSELLADQFPQAPPIFVKDDLIDAFFKQRAFREQQIRDTMQGEITEIELNEIFPMHFDKCVPSFGKPCAYKRLCFSPVQDPLTAGYEYRDSSHELEWFIHNGT